MIFFKYAIKKMISLVTIFLITIITLFLLTGCNNNKDSKSGNNVEFARLSTADNKENNKSDDNMSNNPSDNLNNQSTQDNRSDNNTDNNNNINSDNSQDNNSKTEDINSDNENNNFNNENNEAKPPVETELSNFSTPLKSGGPNRLVNIKLTCAKINEKILQNGETFSFNQIVGSCTPEEGYKKAEIYVNKKIRYAFGGGNCQVSTTLYNSALAVPGIEIVERHEHNRKKC